MKEFYRINTLRNISLRVLSIIAFIILFQNFAVNGQSVTKRFAVIGDYGSDDNHELDVANLVKSWNPDFIITVGDNNYPNGEASTIDKNVGKYYHDYIFPYTGTFGAGATENRFFPSLGNHDWDNRTGSPAQPYLNYFTLPNNERYYDYVQGPVHFFVIDSDSREPDGITGNSVQANWLRTKLMAATEPWKIVYFHHTPFSSRSSTTALQWQFKQWGATAVIAGHAHVYERVIINGFPYFTNGLGGESTGTFGTPISGSVVRFGDDYGAQLVTADDYSITFQFYTQAGLLIDSYTISNLPLNAPSNLMGTSPVGSQVNLSWTDNSSNEDGFRIERCQNAGCTNFTEIANVDADVTTYSDSGRTPNTTYVYRVRAFNSGGSSSYSNAFEITTSAPGATSFSDNFDDNVRDTSKWNVGIFSRSASNFDSSIQVKEQNGRLSITPRSSFTGNAYSGYVSAAAWDFTDQAAKTELVQKASGNAATIFSVGLDKNNWYSFRAKANTLYLESRLNSSTSSVSISYNATQHRFLRLRHDSITDSVFFETSPDESSWTVRRTVTRQFPINAVEIEMIAGTGESVSSPGTALFDNFLLQSTVAPASVPNAPGNLAANAISPSEIDLSWTDNSSDEDGFKIERCQNTGCTNFVEIAQVGANQTTFSDSGLSTITTYRYRVRAFHVNTNSGYSNIAETTTPAPPPTIPEAPSNLTASGVSTSRIDLHWSVNSANEDGFKIERCQNTGCTNFVEIAQVGIDVSQYSDTGLLENTTYAYRVRAFNSAGNSPYSNVAEASTQSSLPPDSPDNLAGTAVSPSRIDLTWNDNSTDENGFKIERCQNAACTNFVEIAQVGVNISAYSDTSVSASNTYRYQVRAFNIVGGNSAYSNIAEITTPSPPASVFSDNFDDNVRDTSKWNLGLFSRNSTYFDPAVLVAEQNQHLSITPRSSFSSNAYNGYLSTVFWSMDNSNMSVEVVQKASSSSATIFSFGIDKDNCFSFRAKSNSLYLESRINSSSTTSVTITYDATQHRFWRFRHIPADNSIVFETSADGTNWIIRRTVTNIFSLTAVQIEMIAGTSSSISSPGTALFDNFQLVTNN